MWMSVYLVAEGEVVREFPVELSELAHRRVIQRKLELDAVPHEHTCWHLFLDRPSKGVGWRVGDGIFLRRSNELPTGVIISASQIQQLAANRAARLDMPTAREHTSDREINKALRKWGRSAQHIKELSPREVVALRLPGMGR
jgi:hypothetical protein